MLVNKKCGLLQVNGSQEPALHLPRVMAAWTASSSNKFRHDVIKNDHGGIRTGRSILVQIHSGDWGEAGFDLQSANQHHAMETAG